MPGRRMLLAAPALLFDLAARRAAAQAWPSRPLRLVIPWPPGQAVDLAARILAQPLAEALGQPVVTDNRAGAGGMIGTDLVAKSAPDGYTLLAASTGPLVTAPLLQPTAYNPELDFANVSIIGVSGYVMVVRSDFPAASAAEFVALLRASPGRYTYASSGTGTAAQVSAAWLHAAMGLDVVHIPFAGTGAALASVVGGHVDYSIESVAGAATLIRAGQLRALGTTLRGGSALLPGIGPLAALPGMADYDAGAWTGFMLPAHTPGPVVERLNGAIGAAMTLPEIRQRLVAAGLEVEFRNTSAMATTISRQRRAFAEAIRVAHIKLDG